MTDCDTVFLTGAHYPRYSLDQDAAVERGVQDVANACVAAKRAGVGRLVYTSSIASLGTDPEGIDETHVPAQMPQSVYRAVKWAMERELDRHATDLDVVTMLPGGCLGPWDVRVGTGGLLVGFITGALPWWVDGIVNLVDVRDVALMHVRAARDGRRGERYCIGGHSLPLREVFTTVRERFGGSFPAELTPEQARDRATEEERLAAQTKARAPFPRELVDIITWSQRVRSHKASEELGFDPRRLEATLDDAYNWFRRYGYLPKNDAKAAPAQTRNES